MIIANGTIQIAIPLGDGGMDANGMPIAINEQFGESIPCNLKTITHNHKGKSIDGEFTNASYEILLDAIVAPHFVSERVRIFDNRKQEIGIFRVQDIQHLDFVGIIKLLV